MRYKCYAHEAEIRQWAAEGVWIAEMQRRLGISNERHIRNFLNKKGIEYRRQDSVGEHNPAWRGGRVIDKDGYVLVKADSHPRADRHGYVREHRLVMERTLGRYLTEQEVVHHKDKNKQNNTPENLEVFDSNGRHLAQELLGQRPNWTPEGFARMKAPRPRANRKGSELGDGP